MTSPVLMLVCDGFRGMAVCVPLFERYCCLWCMVSGMWRSALNGFKDMAICFKDMAVCVGFKDIAVCVEFCQGYVGL